jgi:hypothetical protein
MAVSVSVTTRPVAAFHLPGPRPLRVQILAAQVPDLLLVFVENDRLFVHLVLAAVYTAFLPQKEFLLEKRPLEEGDLVVSDVRVAIMNIISVLRSVRGAFVAPVVGCEFRVTHGVEL